MWAYQATAAGALRNMAADPMTPSYEQYEGESFGRVWSWKTLHRQSQVHCSELDNLKLQGSLRVFQQGMVSLEIEAAPAIVTQQHYKCALFLSQAWVAPVLLHICSHSHDRYIKVRVKHVVEFERGSSGDASLALSLSFISCDYCGEWARQTGGQADRHTKERQRQDAGGGQTSRGHPWRQTISNPPSSRFLLKSPLRNSQKFPQVTSETIFGGSPNMVSTGPCFLVHSPPPKQRERERVREREREQAIERVLERVCHGYTSPGEEPSSNPERRADWRVSARPSWDKLRTLVLLAWGWMIDLDKGKRSQLMRQTDGLKRECVCVYHPPPPESGICNQLQLSGLVAGDSAVCGRLVALFCDCGLRVCDLGSSDQLRKRGALGLRFSNRSWLRPAAIESAAISH